MDKSQTLVGVLSLKQLLLCRTSDRLRDIMSSDVISVEVSTDQAEVARIVERYDFLSLPVVDASRKLVGVITVDDVIDVIREEANEDFYAMGGIAADFEDSVWQHLKSRGPWVLLSLAAGLLAAVMMNKLFDVQNQLQEIPMGYAMLPLLFFVGDTLSSQTVTSCLGFIRSHSKTGHRWQNFLKKEFLQGLVTNGIVGLILVVLFWALPFVFPISLNLVALVLSLIHI